jgi:hypothetical protein
MTFKAENLNPVRFHDISGLHELTGTREAFRLLELWELEILCVCVIPL